MAQAKRKRPAAARPKQQPQAQARRTTTRGRQPSGGAPGWMLFITGLGLGLFVALLVYLNVGGTPRLGTGLRNLLQQQEAAQAAADARAVKQEPEPAALPAAKPVEPHFDFYTVLPEFESVLPEGAAAASPNRREEKDVSYILQAASYGNFLDALKLRDRIGDAGLPARIEKISIENRGDYYRVRLGPYDKLDDLDDANRKLVKLGVKAMRLRVEKTQQ